MLTIMSQSHDNVIGVHGSGKVTDQDYLGILIPKLAEVLKIWQGPVPVLSGQNFEGWEMGAMWEDAKFGLNTRTTSKKLRGGRAEMGCLGTKLFAHFMEGQVKVFPPEELQAAWDWLEAEGNF